MKRIPLLIVILLTICGCAATTQKAEKEKAEKKVISCSPQENVALSYDCRQVLAYVEKIDSPAVLSNQELCVMLYYASDKISPLAKMRDRLKDGGYFWENSQITERPTFKSVPNPYNDFYRSLLKTKKDSIILEITHRKLLTENDARNLPVDVYIGANVCAMYAVHGRPDSQHTTETRGLVSVQHIYRLKYIGPRYYYSRNGKIDGIQD